MPSLHKHHFFLNMQIRFQTREIGQSEGALCPDPTIWWIGYGLGSLILHLKDLNPLHTRSASLPSSELDPYRFVRSRKL